MPRHGEAAKNALLAAGEQLLSEAPMHKTLRSITAREVARRAGKTTGSFYNYWPSQDDFCADLIGSVLAVEPPLEPLASRTLPDLLGLVFDRRVEVDRFRLYLVMAGFGHDSRVAEALDRRAREIERQLGAALGAVLERDGLGLRNGSNPQGLAVAVLALADGYGIRQAGNLDRGHERARFLAAALDVVGSMSEDSASSPAGVTQR